ncbi:orotate phosphoribosyltransferase [Candidatus Binatus sp.]|uniref:orotate phosphoribosyltransferase n=1 Tax=Candidatus Binatus sp. TaxID=2811406 RepID=UPI00272B323F|nr:orotate phosphoribosyltransferase [Candidatus Binatus sp.]
MISERSRLLEILKQTSYMENQTEGFLLASGERSPYYVDCKKALSHPEARMLIGSLIYSIIEKDDPIDAVGGLEIGAYPIATAVSDKIWQETGKSVRAFVARKDQKKHGVGKRLAGDVRQGDKALIVDDVITSGGSAIMAIDRAREEGLEVRRVIALIDREEQDGRKTIEARGVKYDALFTLSDLIHFHGHDQQSEDPGADQKRLVRRQPPRSAAVG